MKKITRILFVIAGFTALGFGIVGIILPVLPTTPFLLLASYCFVKGSETFDKWFKGTKIYKKHLENFVNTRAMTLKQKWTLLLVADFMMIVPLIILDNIYAKIFIVCVILFKFYYFFFKIKTVKEDK